jgi:homoserine O-acetyltransferase/O-succinyltransferase
MIGPGKAFDTNTYWVICANIIGGCKGSTGPVSINPATRPYRSHFSGGHDRRHGRSSKTARGPPADQTALQYRRRFHGRVSSARMDSCAIPKMVRSAICIASAARLSAQAIAFNRSAVAPSPVIRSGNKGGYTTTRARKKGWPRHACLATLPIFRKYCSMPSSAAGCSPPIGSATISASEFAVESYLDYQGSAFTQRFDANSYLYITKAMDYFDISRSYGPLKQLSLPWLRALSVCLLQQRLALSPPVKPGDGQRHAFQR